MPSATSATKLEARFCFTAIGTAWQIDTSVSLTEIQRRAVQSYCDSFDAFFSRFRPDSVMRTLSVSAGSITVPAEWLPLVTFYDALTQVTQGAFTACIGDSLSAAGYDAEYSLRAGSPVGAPDWKKVVRIEGSIMTLDQPVVLDFGAAGKGFLIDRLAQLLKSWDIQSATIDASGDIYTWGGQVETVGLEHPHDPGRVVGAISLQNRALCASATNRRAWAQGVHHIMNPADGVSTTGVQATWVRADSAMIADGIATALFFVSHKQLRGVAPFDYARLHENGSLDYSTGFKGQLYI